MHRHTNKPVKRYSVEMRDGATIFTFSTVPPVSVTNVLRASKECKWMPFLKHWRCGSDRVRMQLDRLLADEGWTLGQSVQAELAPLTVQVSTDANGTQRVRFNRKLTTDSERELRNKLRRVACMDAADERVWLCAKAREREVHNLLTQYSVGDTTGATPASTVPVEDARELLSVNLAVKEPHTITLTFADGLPSTQRLAELRGALNALGYAVSANTEDVETDSRGHKEPSDSKPSRPPPSKAPRLSSSYSAVRASED